MSGLRMTVPSGYIRPDRQTSLMIQQGYAVLNDTGSRPDKEPILSDQCLTYPVLGNLTLGFFSGQADADSGCPSRLDYTKDSRGVALGANLKAWARKNNVSNERRPTVAQGLNLVETFIPMQYGPQVVRECLSRLWSKVTSPGRSTLQNGVGQKDLVNLVLAHLRSAGAFERARPSSVGYVSVPDGLTVSDPAVPIAPSSLPPQSMPSTTLATPPASPINRTHLRHLSTPKAPTGTQDIRDVAIDEARLSARLLRQEEAARIAADESIREDLGKAEASRVAECTRLRNQIVQETADRISGDTSIRKDLNRESDTHRAAIREEHLARSAAEAKAARMLRQEVTDRTASVARESKTRQSEIDRILKVLGAETANRTAQDSRLSDQLRQESDARQAAIRQEHLDRSAAEAKAAHLRIKAQEELEDALAEEALARSKLSARLQQDSLSRASAIQQSAAQESRQRAQEISRLENKMTQFLESQNTEDLWALIQKVQAEKKIVEEKVDGQDGRLTTLCHVTQKILEEVLARKKAEMGKGGVPVGVVPRESNV